MKKIIMVSTHNTCRSFIAESVLRQYLKEAHQEDIEVISRGLVVLFPEPVHPKAADMVRNSGIEILDFQSHQLLQEEVETSDLILTMTEEQKKRFWKNIMDIKKWQRSMNMPELQVQSSIHMAWGMMTMSAALFRLPV